MDNFQIDVALSDRFPIRNGLKQGDALSPLLLNFALEYAITRIKVNWDGLKLNGTHQLMVYIDGVNIFGTSVQNIDAVVVASTEIGLEVNVDKTQYMVMCWDQDEGRDTL